MAESGVGGRNRLSVCFFFNAQRHQLLHGIATARELALDPRFDVHVASPSQGHVEYARQLTERLGGAPITFVHARSRLLAAGMRRSGRAVPPKLLSLGLLARWLNRFDAVAVPERTTVLLKRLGARYPRFIHLDHGAGDRAAGFDPRIRHFDFVLMAGPKHRERLLGERLVRPGAHAVVGYPKFEAADAARDPSWRPFGNDLPTVLYNPHFSDLGSWEALGEQVMAAFADQDRYNLIVAPHVRLLDGDAARRRWEPVLARYADHPRILIDRGGDRAIDMTYTTLADVYLGDVSSQVYEFLRSPKPCLFLNARGVAWEADENYAHWRLGPVLADAAGLLAAVDQVRAEHARWAPAQTEAVARTFLPGGGAVAAAGAIAGYLRQDAMERPRPPARGAVRQGLRRAAALGPVLLGGWMLHGLVQPTPTLAADPFVDQAAASHRTSLLRLKMASQVESVRYDPGELRRMTGISMPRLPAGWSVGDAQLYPSARGDFVQLLVRGPRDERVSLVAMRADTRAGATPMVEARPDERIAYWERGDCAFALVGQVPEARLLQLAADVAGPHG